MEFKILGPLEIIKGAERLELGGTRQGIVMATLLLEPNRVVTMDRLLDAVYGEVLPPTSRSQVQISISSLRRLLAAHGCNQIIATRPHGYAIQVDGGSLDSQLFAEHVAAARAARDACHLDEAVACYREALRLWRGAALDGIYSLLVRMAAGRLDEQRITIIEERIHLELELGRHHELVGELTELVGQFPLREQLRGQLILTLHRCGRSAEALEVYRQARRMMIDELGIEPGERLQRLQHAVLTCDPALDLPAGPVTIQPVKQVPNLLPADIADFTGRASEIRLIHERLLNGAEPEVRPAAPVVVVIIGKGGVGKTTLAVHTAHGLAGQFPDGQLFADLHGGSSHPVSPAQVLERFLRALGVPSSAMPEGLDERAEVYRNLLAARKILVVLDDAAGESQVLPLLPGSGAAGVVITSRRWLAGLAGAAHIEVNVFDAGASIDLLARIAGEGRVQAQAEAAAEVAARCGYLPLALRIAGARLAARPHRTVRQLAERLGDETRRLDELRHGDMGIRPSILFTYDSIDGQVRQLFRRLALLDIPLFSSWLGAALLDVPLDVAEDLLDELVNAQLIETCGGASGVHSQYHFHELIRVFARERLAAEESAAERKAALKRALGALLYLAEQANHCHYGGDYFGVQSDATRWPLPESLTAELVRDPLSWYDQERATLVVGIRQSAQMGLVDLSWSLAFNAVTLFEFRLYLDDWQDTHDIALEATQKTHHIRGQAAMLYSIGSLNLVQQRFDKAREMFSEASRMFLSVGDEQGLALVIRHIAFTDRLTGHLDDAARHYGHALAIFRRTSDHVAAAYVLHGMAQVRLEMHQVGAARELLSEALRLTQAARCSRVEAQVLHRMGEADLMAGDVASAVATFEAVLERTREIADPIGEIYALMGVGTAKIRQGEFCPAGDALKGALGLAAAAGERLAEGRALLGLSELALARDDPGRAAEFGQRASDIFSAMGARLYDARALRLLADAHAALTLDLDHRPQPS
jgi:DNA-binding SARP family transcriptional activator